MASVLRIFATSGVGGGCLVWRKGIITDAKEPHRVLAEQAEQSEQVEQAELESGSL
jgi:hypothetical protein